MRNDLFFQNKLILAPMAGISDYSFRKLCIEQGADYTVTEMVSAKALCYGDKKTAVLARVLKEEFPIAIQIFGSDPEIMAKAAAMLATGNYAYCMSDVFPAAIDINMGCPVHKIVSNGEGSALMKDEKRAEEIISAVAEASAIPVTVKMRAGYDENHINAAKIAEIAEKAGAAAVCIHGRTRERMYRPPVDLEIIREVKRTVHIPVIGNGELMCVGDALRMSEYTGCDSLMIARGALGNPFIFAEIKAAQRGDFYEKRSSKERLEMAQRHLQMMLDHKGEKSGLQEARKHIAWYIKDIPGAPAMRDRVNRIADARTLVKLLEDAILNS